MKTIEKTLQTAIYWHKVKSSTHYFKLRVLYFWWHPCEVINPIPLLRIYCFYELIWNYSHLLTSIEIRICYILEILKSYPFHLLKKLKDAVEVSFRFGNGWRSSLCFLKSLQTMASCTICEPAKMIELYNANSNIFLHYAIM